MHTGVRYKVPVSLFFMLILSFSVLLTTGCRSRVVSHGINLNRAATNQLPASEERSENINFRTFQNPDGTWGFTIFVSNMPYRHYNKIPVPGSESGFVSRKEAETVADLFVRLMSSGEHSPRLTRKALDTLDITLKPIVKK